MTTRDGLRIRAICIVVLAVIGGLGHLPVEAQTLVRMETNMGTVDIELYGSTPVTCANFLTYVNEGAYDNSVVHRSVPGFVIQGGAYALASPQSGYLLEEIQTHDPIINEASTARPNVFGTIAMAQVGTNPNSATSEWFFNTANNSPYLDELNGGFTVFGEIVVGMDVVLAIEALDTWDFSIPFSELPTLDTYTQAMYDGAMIPARTDLVTIYSAHVVPEPGMMALLAAGAMTILRRRRRTRRQASQVGRKV